MARLNYEELNNTIRYTMWSVFRVEQATLPAEREQAGAEATSYLTSLADSDVTVRGLYDVSGLRADADFMIWWHSSDLDALQQAYSGLRRQTVLGACSEPVWSVTALHRPAEFNKSHVPAFLADEEPRPYVCVYPFVRSHDWYLLPDDERRTMLKDHGVAARDFPDVRANTVPSFGLSDYEWVLAFEADEAHRIVDLMWRMRYTEARRHVREEIPFYTGRRVSADELLTRLP